MDKNALTARFAESEDEKTALSHILDIADRSWTKGTVESGSFLSESLGMRAEEMLKAAGYTDFFMWGGYEGAERTCPIFYTDYCTRDMIESEPALADIIFASARLDGFNKDAVLSHRDILGSLMGLGIKRESVGDIVFKDSEALFVIKESISPFVAESLVKIGRYPVKLTLGSDVRMTRSEDFEECFDTVASLRLDAVGAVLFNTSRSVISEAISAGLVSVNGSTVKKCDAPVREGDKLAWRKSGRAQIEKTDGLSKKGRIRLLYKRWQ